MRRRHLGALALLAAILLGAVVLVLTEPQSKEGPDSGLETVEINGVTCIPRKNLRTYLIMGIDDQGEETEDYAVGGMCDMIRLVVVDESHNSYTQLPINRNTLADVDTLDADGTLLGTSRIQISYAHATAGDNDGPRSCENMANSVSKLLYGQKIDGYVSLDMKAVPIINHLAGGVTVTIEDDFSQADPTLVKGQTITLSDEQALHYVRGRMNVGDGTNEGRMRRQDSYVEALKGCLTEKVQEDSRFPRELYQALGAHMVTDMSEKEFSRIANAMVMYKSQGELELTGTIGTDENEFATLEVDQDSLADAVIELFYTRV